jgi:hypothetical protein
LGHVVQGSVGEDDRVLEQSIGIDVAARKSHLRRLPQVDPLMVRCPMSLTRGPCVRPGGTPD